jgi:hypothetical protein
MTTPAVEVAGQLTIGEALRDEGVARVESNNADWSARALRQLRHLAEHLAYFSADDLRIRMSNLDDHPAHHNAYGAVFRRAMHAGWIEATDATCRSERPDAHARRLQVWRSLCLAS